MSAWARAVLPAAAVGALLLVAEAGLRVHYFGLEALLAPFFYRPATHLTDAVADPAIGWRLQPSQKMRSMGILFTTNEHGLRGPPVSLLKTPGRRRIAVLGASVSMGMGVADEEVYSQRLQALLEERFPGRYEVLNFAVAAYSLGQITSAYEPYVQPFDPDLVIVALRVKNFLETLPPRPPVRRSRFRLDRYLGHFYVEPAARMFIRSWMRNHISTDWKSRHGSSAPKLHQVSVKQVLDAFVERRRREGTPVVIVLLETLRPYPPDLRKSALAELHAWAAGHPNVHVIDTLPIAGPALVEENRIYFGNIHPNAAVHTLLARAIFEGLRGLLETASP